MALVNMRIENHIPPPVILLVEDNLINQAVTTQLLNKWGFVVKVANHGEEALQMIVEKCYKAILMDIQMPKMDGCETTLHIREMDDQYFKTIPIIAYTASTIADTKEKAVQLGMTDYIGKPLDPDELRRKLNQYIETQTEEYKRNINFDLYTDGDREFKRKLVNLMIENMRELQEACSRAQEQQDDQVFRKASHKANPTLAIIDDAEFDRAIEELKQLLGDKGNDALLDDKISGFDGQCKSIIEFLEKELVNL